MAINFPDSPTIGDEFTGGGFTWTWNGSSWEKVVASSAAESLVGGGSTFIVDIGDSGNTIVPLLSSKAAGTYTISSSLGDQTYDVYLIASDGSYAGNNEGSLIAATQSFNKLVVYSATQNDVLTFEYKETASPTSHGTQITGVAPYLTSATPTTLESVDDTVTVTGGNFAEDVEIEFVGTDAVERAAKSIVRSSSTELVVTRPDILPPSYEPYSLLATNPGIPNPSTGVNTLSSIIDAGGPITWVTPNLPPLFDGVAYSYSLQATDADGQPVTYSIVSGSLPSGLSLNSTTGLISGTPTSDPQTFTVRALDSGNNTLDKEFSINIAPVITGGTLTSDSTYYYRTFTSSDTLTIANSPIQAEALVIAGGGAGTGDGSGAGGAGGFLPISTHTLSEGSYPVVVGAGGAIGAKGVNSSINGNIAIGGGAGAWASEADRNGGSGGGGLSDNYAPGSGTPGQGNDGGLGQRNTSSLGNFGGGGGGAGAAGNYKNGGNGLNTYSSWASATSTGVGGYYAGGGAATSYRYGTNNNQTGTPGLGGGSSVGGSGGVANTGGGGAGGQETPKVQPSPGGSGVVIIRYTKATVGG